MTSEEKSGLKRYGLIMIIRAITNIALTVYTSNLRDDIKHIGEHIENQTCYIDSKVPIEAVDDLVDRRITKAEQDWWGEWSNFLNRLSSNIYYDGDDYDTVIEQCVDIVKNTH